VNLVPWTYRQEFSATRWYLCTTVYDVTCTNIAIFIVTAMKTSNLKYSIPIYIVTSMTIIRQRFCNHRLRGGILEAERSWPKA
jgi:hypothetical protein